jgi:branched-chain amino acid transport system permease protein
VHSYRVAVTLYSGAIAASGGWLYALANVFVFPDLLGLTNSVNSVLYSLIGGVDTVIGPLVGTIGLRYLVEYLGQQTTQSQLYIGVALLVVVYLLPTGLTGVLRRLWQVRRRLRTSPEAGVRTLLGTAGDDATLLGGGLDETPVGRGERTEIR